MKLKELLPLIDSEVEIEVDELDAPIDEMTVYDGDIDGLKANCELLEEHVCAIYPVDTDKLCVLVGSEVADEDTGRCI